MFESLAFVVCLGVSLYYRDAAVTAFALSAAITFATGLLLRRAGSKARTTLTRYDSFAVVTFSWLACTIMGMLPYLFSGIFTNVTDAFFEVMSGLTSTGATMMNNLESVPNGVHFWRCMTNWIGGMGIVVFTLALLPSNSVGETRLFAAEVTGPKSSKLHPRFKTTTRWLLSTYLLLTVCCMGALWLAGMGMFDSVCHAFSATGTGGFSTHSASIAYFQSPAIEYVLIVFMFLSGINFAMLYSLFFRRKFRMFFTNSEIKAYVLITLVATVGISLCLYFRSGYDVHTAVRSALFQVVSLETTTGFLSDSIMNWFPLTWIFLSFVMFAGACAGSTSGGFKVIRLVALFKITKNEFKYILHPRAVIPVRINNSTMNYSMEHTILAFATLYIAFIFIGAIAFCLTGIPIMDAVGISLTSLSNCGPEIGYTFGSQPSWSVIPDAAKWISALLMFAGRLEIFTIVILFVPRFWKDY